MGAALLRGLLDAWAGTMASNKEELIRLDGLCGDSDLGLTMSAGFAAAAAQAALDQGQDIGRLAYAAGKAMSLAVPSTMGTLMASGLMSAGKALKGEEAFDARQQLNFLAAFYGGIAARGKAAPGDKTVLDSLKPALDALNSSLDEGKPLVDAVRLAAEAAQAGYLSTQGMLARHGRMAIRGEASRQYLDPGAAVAALLMRSWADYVAGRREAWQ
ncbi:MAG: DAK2 domain-containing protein [Christensenellales bacterium]